MSKKKSESSEPAEPVEPAEGELVDAQAMEKVVRQGEVSTTPEAVQKDQARHVGRKEGLGKPRGWARARYVSDDDKPKPKDKP